MVVAALSWLAPQTRRLDRCGRRALRAGVLGLQTAAGASDLRCGRGRTSPRSAALACVVAALLRACALSTWALSVSHFLPLGRGSGDVLAAHTRSGVRTPDRVCARQTHVPAGRRHARTHVSLCGAELAGRRCALPGLRPPASAGSRRQAGVTRGAALRVGWADLASVSADGAARAGPAASGLSPAVAARRRSG